MMFVILFTPKSLFPWKIYSETNVKSENVYNNMRLQSEKVPSNTDTLDLSVRNFFRKVFLNIAQTSECTEVCVRTAVESD